MSGCLHRGHRYFECHICTENRQLHADLAAARAEVERLREDRVASERMLARIAGDNARLREALRKYGGHLQTCMTLEEYKLYPTAKCCTCGLDAALAEQ